MDEKIISEALEAKLEAAQTTEDVIKAFAEEGIEVTREQLEAPVPSGPDGELSEDALDNVSGGSVIDWIRRWYHRYHASKYNRGGGGFSSGGGGGGGFSGGGGFGGGGGSAGGRF